MKRWQGARVALAALALLIAGGPFPAISELTAPPGAIRFVGENAVVTAHGIFHSWKVTSSHVDFADLASSFIVIEIDVASLDTDIERRDDHLRSADFFEVDRWPTATARVHGARSSGEDDRGRARYDARFDLRIRNVTRTVDGSFTVTRDDPPSVEGSLTIDRNDWGIGKPKQRFNPISIGDSIPISFRATLPVSD